MSKIRRIELNWFMHLCDTCTNITYFLHNFDSNWLTWKNMFLFLQPTLKCCLTVFIYTYFIQCIVGLLVHASSCTVTKYSISSWHINCTWNRCFLTFGSSQKCFLESTCKFSPFKSKNKKYSYLGLSVFHDGALWNFAVAQTWANSIVTHWTVEIT